jgi:hypothetical protein
VVAQWRARRRAIPTEPVDPAIAVSG